MSSTITFFDIPSLIPGRSFSPFTWATRYSLNFKALPFKTEWIEFSDIPALCKKLGAAPTSTLPNGDPFYTLPVIYDPTTGRAVSDSLLIAEYLDATYPDNPPLFPRGTRGLHGAFRVAHFTTILPVFQFVIPFVPKKLNPASREYFTSTREIFFGAKFDSVPEGEHRETEWNKVKHAFDVFATWYGDKNFILEDTISYADFAVAASLQYMQRVWGADSTSWKEVKNWNGGRWGSLLEEIRKYEGILNE